MSRRVSSGTPWEPVVGYRRAVAAGDHVYVAGCAPVDLEAGTVVSPGDAYAQTKQAPANVVWALEQLGCSAADVVRTRIFVTDIFRWEEYGRAHGEFFADVRPATSMVEVSRLIEPAMLVEIEADAYKPGLGSGARP
jgi:enamine deaminase RidA (YjgF/YER057c/UK114 family)